MEMVCRACGDSSIHQQTAYQADGVSKSFSSARVRLAKLATRALFEVAQSASSSACRRTQAQRTVLERRHLNVEAAADPRDLATGYPRRDPHGRDQVVDAAGRDPLHVGLGDGSHRWLRLLVDPCSQLKAHHEEGRLFVTRRREPRLSIPKRVASCHAYLIGL